MIHPTLFLALRYLRPRRTYVSVITIISVLGVTLGVMVLILVISVMTGFDTELRKKVLGLNSHITITSSTPIRDWKKTADLVRKRPGVRGVAPFIVGPVLAKYAGRVFPIYLKGIDPALETEVSSIETFVKKGKMDLDGEKIIIGHELARRNGLFLNDKLTLYSPKDFDNNQKVAHLPAEPIVAGIFESGMFEYDVGFIFCSLETAQDLYDIGNSVHGLAVMTDDLEGISKVQRDLNEVLPQPLHASTWMEQNRRLFSAIAVEKNMMFFLLIFIIIVAAFGIMNTLITVTVQKTREIAILKSIGATPANILVIFLTQGTIVGVVGTGIGLTCGLTLLYYRNEFLRVMRNQTGLELFPADIYSFDQLPAQTSAKDILIICGSALLICMLAGLFPAIRAARLQPAAALREF